jgi:hypothetical protein
LISADTNGEFAVLAAFPGFDPLHGTPKMIET